MHQDFTVFGNGPYYRGKGALAFRKNLLTPLQSRISLFTSQFASSVLRTGENVFCVILAYPHAKIHGVTYRNTVILNDQKYFLLKKAWSVWLDTGKPARVYGLNETLGFD
jgi:hypothetical protein